MRQWIGNVDNGMLAGFQLYDSTCVGREVRGKVRRTWGVVLTKGRVRWGLGQESYQCIFSETAHMSAERWVSGGPALGRHAGYTEKS